jgi:hypothetical protein
MDVAPQLPYFCWYCGLTNAEGLHIENCCGHLRILVGAMNCATIQGWIKIGKVEVIA